jgi:hypothetical protein
MFNEYGHFTGKIPDQCVEDCTIPGFDATCCVREWVEDLGFTVPQGLARAYLEEFGSALHIGTDSEITERVLWIACGDIKENGEWLGLVH